MAFSMAPSSAVARQLRRQLIVWRIVRWPTLAFGLVAGAAGGYGFTHNQIVWDSVGNWRSGGPSLSAIAYMLGVTSILSVLVLLMGVGAIVVAGSRWEC